MCKKAVLKDISKGMLEELYWGQGLNCRQIGEVFGVTKYPIHRRMSGYHIPIRGHSEARKGRPGWKGPLKDVTKEILEDLYWGQQLSSIEIAKHLGVTFGAIIHLMKRYKIHRRTISEAKKGHPFFDRTGIHPSEETRQKLSEAHKRNPSRYWLGKTHSDETRQKLSDIQQASGGFFFGKHHSDKTKRDIAEKARRRWQDPEYAARIMATRNIRPNKAERALEMFLGTHFPGRYQYTGDGSLIIRGMIPDFANCNGKKEILELFGDYFHSGKIVGTRWHQTELGRIMAFNSLGFRCLVIWENELKDQDKLLNKIIKFQGKRR